MGEGGFIGFVVDEDKFGDSDKEVIGGVRNGYSGVGGVGNG